MQKITPFLWFDGKAEEAANFYASVLPDAKVLDVVRYGKAGPGPEGSAMTVRFAVGGQEFVALNGGPQYHFTPAVSFVVNCDTQEEVDRLWDKFCEEGQEVQCGWVTDKFGLSWQIVPRELPAVLGDPDPARAQRAMQAMMKMKKLDIAALKAARDGV